MGGWVCSLSRAAFSLSGFMSSTLPPAKWFDKEKLRGDLPANVRRQKRRRSYPSILGSSGRESAHYSGGGKI
jgi:hypothetical protein